MSEWFFVLALILGSLIATFALAEWLSHRYSVEIRRRMGPAARGEPGQSGDPFGQGEPDERSGG